MMCKIQLALDRAHNKVGFFKEVQEKIPAYLCKHLPPSGSYLWTASPPHHTACCQWQICWQVILTSLPSLCRYGTPPSLSLRHTRCQWISGILSPILTLWRTEAIALNINLWILLGVSTGKYTFFIVRTISPPDKMTSISIPPPRRWQTLVGSGLQYFHA